jgi:hypothetical protein
MIKLIFLISSKAQNSIRILSNDVSINTKNVQNSSKFFKIESNFLLITATAIDQPSKYNRFSFLCAKSLINIDYKISKKNYYGKKNNYIFHKSCCAI